MKTKGSIKVRIAIMTALMVFAQMQMSALPVLADGIADERDKESSGSISEKNEEFLKEQPSDDERTEIISENGKTQYIVRVEGEQKFQNVREQCNGQINTEYNDILEESNQFVAKLTKQQAEKMEQKKDVSVETDYVLTGADEDTMAEEVQAINQIAEDAWNVSMIGCDKGMENAEYSKAGTAGAIATASGIKVAVLDSGRTFSTDIQYQGGCNLVNGEDDSVGMDLTTHGTAVEGIIAAQDNHNQTQGVAPDAVGLYSVKVLDGNNETTVSRLIAGIQWCIENDIDIINMSMGTTYYSKALENVIKRAEKKGMLMVASVGNSGDTAENQVEYPAAFDEVIGVGSVDAQGKRSSFSAMGEGVELMAPGENVPLASLWGGVTVGSGTSYAAPHVTGVAARLWALHADKSADFIRNLLQKSAHQIGTAEEYGCGLVDYEYAMEQYSLIEEEYQQQGDSGEEQLPDNETEIPKYELPQYAKANWNWKNHQDAVMTYGGGYGLTQSELKIVALSATISDKEIGYNEDNDNLKGYNALHAREQSNYVAAAQYLMNVATDVYWTDATIPEIRDRCTYQGKASIDDKRAGNHDGLVKAVTIAKDVNFAKHANDDEGETYTLNKKTRALQVLGLTLHVVQDAVCHRSMATDDFIPYLSQRAYYFKDFDETKQVIIKQKMALSDLNKYYAKKEYRDEAHSFYVDNPGWFVDRYNVAVPAMTGTILRRFCQGKGYSAEIFYEEEYTRRMQYLVEHLKGVHGSLPSPDGITADQWRARSFCSYHK